VSVSARICSRLFMTVVVVGAAVAAALVLAVFASAPGEAASTPGSPPPVVYNDKDSPNGDPSNEGIKVFVRCPHSREFGHPRYEATGGGFDVHANPKTSRNWVLTASRPSLAGEGEHGHSPAGEGWVVEAIKKVPDYKPPRFTAYAVCAQERLLGPNGATYDGSASTTVGGGKIGEVFTSCAPGSRVVGGGFDFHGNRYRAVNLVRTERTDNRTWQIGAKFYAGSSTPRAEISAYRVCVPEEALRTLDYERAVETGDGIANANTPPCPDGTHLLSGGAGVANSEANDPGAPIMNPLWSHIRPATQSRNWSSGAYKLGSWPYSTKLTLWAFAVCAEFTGERASRSSGKNPSWDDGKGGWSFK
jgi:hypothetical protein